MKKLESIAILGPLAATLPATLVCLALGCGVALCIAGTPARAQVLERLYRSSMRAVLHGAVAHAGGRVGARTQGYLGIEFHDISDEQAAALHLKSPHGVEIIMVDHDGPAGKAGLRAHDIILALNGQIVTGAEALRRMIHEAGAGTEIALDMLRGGKPMSISAELADRDVVARNALQQLSVPNADTASAGGGADEVPSESFTSEPASPVHGQSFIGSMLHSAPFTGLALQVMEPQLAGFFGAPEGMGLLVETVAPGSPAANAGLRAGDILLRADGYALKTESDWSKQLHASKGHTMNLIILREKQESMIVLLPAYRR